MTLFQYIYFFIELLAFVVCFWFICKSAVTFYQVSVVSIDKFCKIIETEDDWERATTQLYNDLSKSVYSVVFVLFLFLLLPIFLILTKCFIEQVVNGHETLSAFVTKTPEVAAQIAYFYANFISWCGGFWHRLTS